MKLVLPYPPSSNRYWRNFRGRTVISAEAREYRQLVASLCLAQSIRPMTGELFFEAAIYRPQKRGDLSNRIKVLEDALQGHAFFDDKQITQIRLSRHDDKKNPRVEVTVEPARSR